MDNTILQGEVVDSPHCGQTLDAHIEAIGYVLGERGITATCRGNYEAVVELAEIMRLLGGHLVYTSVVAARKVEAFRFIQAQMGRNFGEGE